MSTTSTWLITGASRGIGLEFVCQLITANNTVFATVRSLETASQLYTLAAIFPGLVHIIQHDVTDPTSTNDAAKRVDKILGPRGLDYLVNNAGICIEDHPLTMTHENFVKHAETNVVGPARAFQAFLPMLERSVRHDRPVVVNMSSNLASLGTDLGSGVDPAIKTSYSMSKTALNMLTHKQAKEKQKIIFLAMDPGWVKTDMGGVAAPLEIPVSVTGQLRQITAATLKDSGTFKRYDGTISPW